jgi:phosphate transport system substrate-binding protein
MKLLSRIRQLLIPITVPLLLVFTAAAASGQQRIVVGGTGDSQKLLRKIAAIFEENFKNTVIEVPDSIGSGGGIRAVAAGRIDLARVARPFLKKEEKLGLTYRPFALCPISFVVHQSVTGVETITTDEIIGIYSGRITEWKELGGAKGKIYPIIREPGDSCMRVLEERLSGFSEIVHPKAYIVYTTPETIKVLSLHKNTFGFLPLAMIKNTNLKILKVNGIVPSPDNIRNGQYRLTVPFGIVYKGKPEGLSKRFIDFLFSEKAKEIIMEYGTLPLSP